MHGTSSLKYHPEVAAPAGSLCSDLVSTLRLDLNLQNQIHISNNSEGVILLWILKEDKREIFLKIT